jgi:hypothetical protein
MRTILFWIATACLAPAQEPQPAPELSHYDRLLGSWESSGTVNMGPEGAASAPWTAVSHSRKVMGGHFVRTDMRIDIQGEQPGTLGFITFYGWDPERKRHVAYEVSNMGMLAETEVNWLDADTMLTVSASNHMGQPTVERWITKLKKDSHELVGEKAVGDGSWHVHVQGKSTKSKDEKRVAVADLGPFMVAPDAAMADARKLAGTYEVKGAFTMNPADPLMEFSGQETAKPIFGGTILEFTVSGEPGNFEGWNALAYDPAQARYRMVGLSSMGFACVQDGWRVGKDWVFTAAGTFQGTPTVNRTTISLDETGHMAKASAQTMTGTSEPYTCFHATYTLKGRPEAGTRPAGAGREGER